MDAANLISRLRDESLAAASWRCATHKRPRNERPPDARNGDDNSAHLGRSFAPVGQFGDSLRNANYNCAAIVQSRRGPLRLCAGAAGRAS